MILGFPSNPQEKGMNCGMTKNGKTMGFLFHLKTGDPTPVMEILSWPEVEREEAKTIATREIHRMDWCGPRQVIFMHRDGTVELWDSQNFQ